MSDTSGLAHTRVCAVLFGPGTKCFGLAWHTLTLESLIIYSSPYYQMFCHLFCPSLVCHQLIRTSSLFLSLLHCQFNSVIFFLLVYPACSRNAMPRLIRGLFLTHSVCRILSTNPAVLQFSYTSSAGRPKPRASLSSCSVYLH